MADDLMSAYSKLFSISLASTTPLAVRAAIKLDLFNIISREVSGATLEKILAQLKERYPTDSPQSGKLFRLLRFLASKKIIDFDSAEGRYKLNSVSKLLTSSQAGESSQLSLAPIVNFFTSDLALRPWEYADESIRNPGYGVGFQKANGMDLKEYLAHHPEAGQTIEEFRVGLNNITFATMIKNYDGFANIKQLVDVGGGTGSFLAQVLKVYPHIQAVNFDLPHVLENLPEYPGVKNVPGDAFVDIPPTDAIFIKNVVHMFNDEQAAKLMENCYKALSNNGKALICDMVLDEENEAHLDFDMMSLTGFDRFQRTAEDWKLLLSSAGFEAINFYKICTPFSIIEALKR